MCESVVMLHGFGGTSRAFDGVIAALRGERYRPVPLDLPGHGEAAGARRPISFEGCVESVLDRSPSRFVLVGYSMGGRVALRLALDFPERVSRLVLVSSTAGLADAEQRARRRGADDALADQIEQEPFERFVERWRSQPLFVDEPEHARRLAVQDMRRNRPDALAAALRGAGTGAMPSMWERLRELSMPVTLLVGERDARFRAIGEEMERRLPDGRLCVVPGGHGLLLESPAAVAAAIEQEVL